MTIIFIGPVRVSYSQMYFVTGTACPDYDAAFAGFQNYWCGPGVPGVLVVTCGRQNGSVEMTVGVSDVDPGIDESAGWQDIVEVSFRPDGDTVTLLEWGGQREAEFALAAGMDYRVRWSGRGIDAAVNSYDASDADKLLDSYRMDFWPAPPAEEELVRVTSGVGRADLRSRTVRAEFNRLLETWDPIGANEGPDRPGPGVYDALAQIVLFELGIRMSGAGLREFLHNQLIDGFGMTAVEVPEALIADIETLWAQSESSPAES